MNRWIEIRIKPMGLNNAYWNSSNGRIKTTKARNYQEVIGWQLPALHSMDIPEKIELQLVFGVSSKLQDLDNCVKLFQDTLAKKYLFNDRDVYAIQMKKRDVKKGMEYIKFRINDYFRREYDEQSVKRQDQGDEG